MMSRSRSLLAQLLMPGLLVAVGCQPATLTPEEDDGAAVEQRTAQGARPPSLTRVDPVSLITGADAELTITGKGFVPGLSVSVGGVLAPPPRTVSSTKIQVALPAGLGAATAVAVKVTLPDGRSGERSDLFSILVDPISLA